MFRYWFINHPMNSKVMNLIAMRETFLNGGYYRVDIDPKVSVLALNTVMYLFKNYGIPYQGNQQMDQLNWLEKQLQESPADHKFILASHIYLGIKFEAFRFRDVWNVTLPYAKRFTSILVKYHEKILVHISGHDHHADIRYH